MKFAIQNVRIEDVGRLEPMVREDAVLDEIEDLIKAELRLGRYLERASRGTEDPATASWLWRCSGECRDHARILSRHRRHIGRDRWVRPSPPRWKRGEAPQPEEALSRARSESSRIATECVTIGELLTDPWFKKLLDILADAHAEQAEHLTEIAE